MLNRGLTVVARAELPMGGPAGGVIWLGFLLWRLLVGWSGLPEIPDQEYLCLWSIEESGTRTRGKDDARSVR